MTISVLLSNERELVGPPLTEHVQPEIGRVTGEGDSLVLLRFLMQQQHAAYEYALEARRAKETGYKSLSDLFSAAAIAHKKLIVRAQKIIVRSLR